MTKLLSFPTTKYLSFLFTLQLHQSSPYLQKYYQGVQYFDVYWHGIIFETEIEDKFGFKSPFIPNFGVKLPYNECFENYNGIYNILSW